MPRNTYYVNDVWWTEGARGGEVRIQIMYALITMTPEVQKIANTCLRKSESRSIVYCTRVG